MGWGGAVGGPPPSVTGAAVCGQQGSPLDSLDTRRAWGLGRTTPLTGPAGCATARSARAPRPSAAPARSRLCGGGARSFCAARSRFVRRRRAVVCAAAPRSRLGVAATQSFVRSRHKRLLGRPRRRRTDTAQSSNHTPFTPLQRCEPARGRFAHASWAQARETKGRETRIERQTSLRLVRAGAAGDRRNARRPGVALNSGPSKEDSLERSPMTSCLHVAHDRLSSCRHDQSFYARTRRTSLKRRPSTISTGGRIL